VFSKYVHTIGSNAIRNLNNVFEIFIPNNIQTIQKNAFVNCSNLTTVYTSAKNIDTEAFGSSNVDIIQI